MRAGSGMKPALHNLCCTIWKSEKLPENWQESTLIQLYKGSGPRNSLQNQRFIHLKDEFPKFFGNLVMTKAKDKLINNMSKYQIGTKPGHRAQELLKLGISLGFDKKYFGIIQRFQRQRSMIYYLQVDDDLLTFSYFQFLYV